MKYQIAEYVIDTARYRISNGDAVLAVEPKVFDPARVLDRASRPCADARRAVPRSLGRARGVGCDAQQSRQSARKVLGDSGGCNRRSRRFAGAATSSLRRSWSSSRTWRPAEATKLAGACAPPVRAASAERAAFGGCRGNRRRAVRCVGRLGRWSRGCRRRREAEIALRRRRALRCLRRCARAWQPFADQVTLRELIRKSSRKISGLKSRADDVGVHVQGRQDAREHIRNQAARRPGTCSTA